MVGSESSYTSSRCFFYVKKTLAGQDDSITRLNQRNWQAIDPINAVGCFNDARCDGVGQGGKSGHNEFLFMVYRRIAGYFE
jgi:hypothetical protein